MKRLPLILAVVAFLILAALPTVAGGWVPGNLAFNTPAVATITTGSCSTETCTSPDGVCADTRGEVTAASCGAGQTMIIAFSGTLTRAPTCTCTAANAAADVVTLGAMFCRATASALTITWPTGITAGAASYHCFQ